MPLRIVGPVNAVGPALRESRWARGGQEKFLKLLGFIYSSRASVNQQEGSILTKGQKHKGSVIVPWMVSG